MGVAEKAGGGKPAVKRLGRFITVSQQHLSEPEVLSEKERESRYATSSFYFYTYHSVAARPQTGSAWCLLVFSLFIRTPFSSLLLFSPPFTFPSLLVGGGGDGDHICGRNGCRLQLGNI